MILVDAAPLIALIDAGQGETHRRFVEVYAKIVASPLLTTWCCFTKAMYFFYQLRGWQAQIILWQFTQRKALFLHPISSEEQQRIQDLMEQYQDVPMDLADEDLVAAAEALGVRRIFSLDTDFYLYRWRGTEAFEVIP